MADNVRSIAELEERATVLKSNEDLIEGAIPKQQLSLVVGDTGLGKSPLLYQAAVCVAAGEPFLGKPVRQGKVLYMDCENGIEQAKDLVAKLTRFLSLKEDAQGRLATDLRLWNLNDAGEDYGKIGHQFTDIIRREQPSWAILDTIKTLCVGIGKSDDSVALWYGILRKLMAELQCTITGVHHPRKKPKDPNNQAEPLETTGDVREWFEEASGSKSLVTNCDLRWGIDKAQSRCADLVVRGWERVKGEFPPLLLSRVMEDEEPIGYRLVTGVETITNLDHRALWAKLPRAFRFKEAVAIYGKGGQPTTNALKAFQHAQILRKLGGSAGYEKVEGVIIPEPSIWDHVDLRVLH